MISMDIGPTGGISVAVVSKLFPVAIQRESSTIGFTVTAQARRAGHGGPRRFNFWYRHSFKRGEVYMAIDQSLLDILVCPKCKGDIHLNDTQDGLICEQCCLLYEIRDDIPIMLIEEAQPFGTHATE